MGTERSIQTLKAPQIPIKSVTVYNKRAEVTRVFKVVAKSGINEIQIEQFASTIVPNSISVVGQGHATILDVKEHSIAIEPLEADIENVKKWKAELKELEKKIREEKDLYDIQDTKLKALNNVFAESVSTKSVLFSAPSQMNMKDSFQFYEETADGLNVKMREIRERGSLLEEKIKVLTNSITKTALTSTSKPVISIVFESEIGEAEKEEVELTLVYLVQGASWTPFYDLRVNTKMEKPEATLHYYANIKQATGEDWKKADISLSTSDSMESGTLPKLETMMVNFVPPPQHIHHNVSQQRGLSLFGSAYIETTGTSLFGCSSNAQPQSGTFGAQPSAPTPPPPMKHEVTVAEESILSTTFIIPRQSTIPSDSTKHKVTIGIEKLSAILHHECVPKKDTKVYLTATVINSSDYFLLPGPVTVYVDNSLSTTFNLKAVASGEKFDCALGIDKSVQVSYKPAIKNQSKISAGVFTNHSSYSCEQQISVNNRKREAPIVFTLYESIPKSVDERIKIRVMSPDPIQDKASLKLEKMANDAPPLGPFLDESHNLMWTEKVKADEAKEFIIKWAVDYPAEEKLKFENP